MKTKLIISAVALYMIAAGLYSCNKDKHIADPPTVHLNLPDEPYQYFSGVSDEIATLGRVLFYDNRLSVNNGVSCATCHKQEIAFSDNVALSRGFENKLTLRNTLPIQNVRESGFFGEGEISLFWDGRAKSLNSMVVMPVMNHIEMGMDDEKAIVEKIKKTPYYPTLFNDAFGSEEIDIDKISTALSAFTGSIRSSNTRFDNHLRSGSPLSAKEEAGRRLFFTKYECNSCHQTEMPSGYQFGGGFNNIGLQEDYDDDGVGSLEGKPEEDGKFKIPNLRNVALTAPYMHDGSFATLEEVIDHYSKGIKNHPNLDIRLRGADGLPVKFNISESEKSSLIAFLHTLTDYTMITDPKYSNPFRAE